MFERKYSACIVAAGRGERAGQGPAKQFRLLAGKSVLRWSVEQFARDPQCTQILIAHAPGQAELVHSCLPDQVHHIDLVEGGTTRSQSVAALLNKTYEEFVLIHDAARPFLTQNIIDELLYALNDHAGAAPALAITDALVRENIDGFNAIDRSDLYRMQTPQAFKTQAIKTAFKNHRDVDFPDEVSLARAQGLTIARVQGSETNIKLTWPSDFKYAEQIAHRIQGPTQRQFISGTGYDVHRLAPGDGLHLCGVFIEGPFRLIGHSDADVGMHAITDAVLGAIGAGDIGEHFPPSDNQWQNADSKKFLSHASNLAREQGATIIHVDVTFICEAPKIGPHKMNMCSNIAKLLGLKLNRVNVKATTTEKLGFTGRGEGIAAQAIVTVSLPED